MDRKEIFDRIKSDHSKYLIRWVRNGKLETFEHTGFKGAFAGWNVSRSGYESGPLPAQLIRLSDGEIIKDTFTLREYALIATQYPNETRQ